MQTTDTPGRTWRRKDAHSDRRRILAAARRKLREDPDASLDSISQAAGVARRTVATAFLLAAGVAPQRAAFQVQEVIGRDRAAGAG
ncbi:hypothetical protein [Streptomyces sp. NBC_00557]|uniref:hypothetical protein n=1 Tax=Streptomyces sp. NBC_00557 TaxID=2975776 RepID=UPI002E80BA10|nr:hypothetical protein [Streptomyces sp. NBC_00557]WUC33937.1 hypothetical protein OG956_06840 [Streptomyces sp. NBC_00557]